MNRNDEYNALMDSLETTPPALEYTLARARAKRSAAKKRNIRAVFAPLGSLMALCLVFVLLVNVSPSFAYAAGRVPLLRELAKAVAASPSLSAAVENQYVQPIELEQTDSGITARVEYVIVDQKQLDIFYTLRSDSYFAMDATPEIKSADGSTLEGFSIQSGSYYAENGTLLKMTVDFSDTNMPENLILRLRVHDNGSNDGEASVVVSPAPEKDDSPARHTAPVPVAVFEFSLQLDPQFTAKGQLISLNREFTLEGQQLTLTSIEIYPTHMRLNFDDKPENTAWLKALSFYVEDEKGRRFESIADGITAKGKQDSPMFASFYLESSYFAESKQLTLYITGATWLDKDMETISIDLENSTADKLPDSVRLESVQRQGKDCFVVFSAPLVKENSYYQIIDWDYTDAAGESRTIGESSTMEGYANPDTGEYTATPDRFAERLLLQNYPYGSVSLHPSFSRRSDLAQPIALEIK